MTPVASVLREEIARDGPISFHRFMDLALYHPRHGYYRRGRDPFGRAGDYYTAEQLQPVFGRLMAARIRALFEELGAPREFTVVELGAGRAEMAEALAGFRYLPVEVDGGALPERFTGVVFANEFFDALPVHLAVRRGGGWREMRVGAEGDRFAWVEAAPVGGEMAAYLSRYTALEEEGALAEVNLEALGWLERIARSLERGFLLAIDYGYTLPESVRFPRGTLMSYRRHQADEDVLAEPGERDITAHVSFTALERHGETCGLQKVRLEPLARILLAAGERDQFAAALAGATAAEQARHRLQLKSLLVGLGETFRVLLQRKGEPGEGEK
ncbi:MAG: SAM-dependent methyltransferase [Acidobacteriota bacterium]